MYKVQIIVSLFHACISVLSATRHSETTLASSFIQSPTTSSPNSVVDVAEHTNTGLACTNIGDKAKHAQSFYRAYRSYPGNCNTFKAYRENTLEIATGQPLGYSSAGPPNQTPYPCPKCDRVFTNYMTRVFHIETVHEGMSFTCFCGKVYKYRTGLQTHLRKSPICASLKESGRPQPLPGQNNFLEMDKF